MGKEVNISYRGNLAKISFSVAIEEDKQKLDVYADNVHFETFIFDAQTSHADMIANVKSNLFGT